MKPCWSLNQVQFCNLIPLIFFKVSAFRITGYWIRITWILTGRVVVLTSLHSTVQHLWDYSYGCCINWEILTDSIFFLILCIYVRLFFVDVILWLTQIFSHCSAYCYPNFLVGMFMIVSYWAFGNWIPDTWVTRLLEHLR